MLEKVRSFIQHSTPAKILIGTIYAGVLIGVFLPHILHHAQTGKVSKDALVQCRHTGKTIVIDINDKTFLPSTTYVKSCDIIIFKNIGTKYLEPAFGDHPLHLLYPGFHEVALKPGQENQVVMSAFGLYKIHEHIYDKINGEIIVEK